MGAPAHSAPVDSRCGQEGQFVGVDLVATQTAGQRPSAMPGEGYWFQEVKVIGEQRPELFEESVELICRDTPTCRRLARCGLSARTQPLLHTADFVVLCAPQF